jgi:hypothetical protein
MPAKQLSPPLFRTLPVYASLCMLRRYTWESQKKKLQHYKRRQPETSVLYQIVYHGHEELQHVWEPRFQHQYGCLRDEVTKTLTEYLITAASSPTELPGFTATAVNTHCLSPSRA